MKILVTGAKGFVGKNLVSNLYNIKEGKNRTRQLQSIHLKDGRFMWELLADM